MLMETTENGVFLTKDEALALTKMLALVPLQDSDANPKL